MLHKLTNSYSHEQHDSIPHQYLTYRGWCAILLIAVAITWGIPAVWLRMEKHTGTENYRIPFHLSEDYLSVKHWIANATSGDSVLFMGDSVIWGQYARPDETLTAGLNSLFDGKPLFSNLGVDGAHPLALAGLLRAYGGDIAGKRVALYFNPLWLSQPFLDLQGEKAQYIFHTHLLPQFDLKVTCYNATINERVDIYTEQLLPLKQLARHWQILHWKGLSWQEKILNTPWAFPEIGATLPPQEPSPLTTPIPWTEQNATIEVKPWVSPSSSNQLAAFVECIRILQSRGNHVLLLLGQYNSHMLPVDGIADYQRVYTAVRDTLTSRATVIELPLLPSEMYGDSSHPLPSGYERIAAFLAESPVFLNWLGVKKPHINLAKNAPARKATPSEQNKALPIDANIEQLLVKGGEFTMGDAEGREDEKLHRVKISSFYIDKSPVTQAAYEKVMGSNPSRRRGQDLPVEQIRWREAIAFCNRCSELENLQPCYDLATGTCDFSANGYRLPTEAEWEYGCRAGTTTRYFFGNSDVMLAEFAWFKSNSGGQTRPVGEKRANPWGVYDMAGNVWEWCNDWYDAYQITNATTADPTGPKEGKFKVVRGGAFDSPAERCRSAYRFKAIPDFHDVCEGYNNFGFRRVRSAAAAQEEKGDE